MTYLIAHWFSASVYQGIANGLRNRHKGKGSKREREGERSSSVCSKACQIEPDFHSSICPSLATTYLPTSSGDEASSTGATWSERSQRSNLRISHARSTAFQNHNDQNNSFARSLAFCQFGRASPVKLYKYRYGIRCPGHILSPAPLAINNEMTDIWALESLQSRLLAIRRPSSPFLVKRGEGDDWGNKVLVHIDVK